MVKSDESTPQRRWHMSRRGFLIGLGVTGALVAIGVKVGVPYGRLRVAGLLDSLGGPPGGINAPPTTWFEVTAENKVRLFIPKIEMGQGVHTSLAQIGAEELEIEWEQVEVVQATTNSGLNDPAGTGGSNSVSSLFTPMREAAATLREMLRAEAAVRLGVPAASLVVANGIFAIGNDPEKAITYGELVQGKSDWEVPEEPPQLKPASQFRLIGQPIPRVDFTAKLTGQAVYGFDMRLPGMLYGAVARPPRLDAKLRRAAPGNAPSNPGVVQVVAEEDFAAVAATSRREAYLGIAAMDLEWEEGTPWQQEELEAMVTVGEGTAVVIQKEGNAQANLRDGQIVLAEYRTPMAAHAHLEPQAALVDVQPDKVIAYVATQSPFVVRGGIAETLGRKEEDVEVIPTYLGGGFGRRLNVEAAREAARLSAAAGRPVHVGWNRQEEFRNGYFRPPTHSILKAALDDHGRIQALEHQQASGDVAFPFLPGIAGAVLGADFGAWRGALLKYDVPHKRTVAWRNKLPVRTGWWRGLGLLANVFAIESFMDELAHTAGVDPLDFRLRHLPDDALGQRFRRVLETVAEKSGWGTALPEGRARGVACAVDVNTVVAQVAEVSVEEGHIRVHRVTAVMDPGLVINPDGAKAQTEGSIIMGLSSTLFEEVTIADGQVVPANFDRYPLLTMKESPAIDVTLLESGDEPFGVGEPPIGPVAAAVANAMFTLTGLRLRRMPLRLPDSTAQR